MQLLYTITYDLTYKFNRSNEDTHESTKYSKFLHPKKTNNKTPNKEEKRVSNTKIKFLID